MRPRQPALLAVFLCAVSALAHAQVPAVAQASPTAIARLSADDVVARLLTYDRNQDGRVETMELVERMRRLIDDGDANGDAALDRAEILQLARRPVRPVVRVGAAPIWRRDEGELLSRSHIEGTLEDMGLESSVMDRALVVVGAFLDALEASAKTDLVKGMASALTAEQLVDFEAAIERPDQMRSLLLLVPPMGTSSGTCPGVGIFCNPTVLTSQGTSISVGPLTLPLGPTLTAMRRFTAGVRFGDTQRSELLEQLNGILDDEEREDFGAALARRPVVAVSR